ncbi:MAG: hypothetical protein ACI9ON_004409, partial [Limisphaerales bacterium]
MICKSCDRELGHKCQHTFSKKSLGFNKPRN